MDVRVTPLGHASVLLEIGPRRLVTDPVLGTRCGPSAFGRSLGPERVAPAALTAETLPPVDAILLSHAHWDHLDKPTLRALPAAAVCITPPGLGDLVRRFGDRCALPWGQATLLEARSGPTIRVTAGPAKHWGARVVVDRFRGYGGYLLEVPDLASEAAPGKPLSIWFAGDTAYTQAYRELRASRGGAGVDLALMPIGAYDPWVINHCTPEQAHDMALRDLGALRMLPIHYDTFRLSREPLGEPLSRLKEAAARAGEPERIVGMRLGVPFPLR